MTATQRSRARGFAKAFGDIEWLEGLDIIFETMPTMYQDGTVSFPLGEIKYLQRRTLEPRYASNPFFFGPNLFGILDPPEFA